MRQLKFIFWKHNWNYIQKSKNVISEHHCRKKKMFVNMKDLDPGTETANNYG